MMMIPETYIGRDDLPADLKGFYAYHQCLMEAWDGPAAIAFSDGRLIGATLDRNGLRPGRWYETRDGWVVMASETGVLDDPPESILRKGRLQPGRLFLVDLDRGRIVDDHEIKHEIATRKPYARWYDEQVVRLADMLPADVKVCVVADRGFGDQKLYRFLSGELKFDYLIRFRGNINVTAEDGETRLAADWVGSGGRSRALRNAAVTADQYQVGTVVCVHAKDMKEPWCLAASTTSERAKKLITTYGKRWTIEPGFRDTKDLRFGMGMGSIRVSDPQRRDRLWLLNAFAIALLTILGAAGEALGYDRHLKSNTTKRRTHSLFRQGAMLYDLIPKMPETRLRPLIERFEQMLNEIPLFAGVYGVI